MAGGENSMKLERRTTRLGLDVGEVHSLLHKLHSDTRNRYEPRLLRRGESGGLAHDAVVKRQTSEQCEIKRGG
jgi:hypothetical protein